MTAPHCRAGDRVLITGNTPHSGECATVRDVNPAGYLSAWYVDQNIYGLKLDDGTRSIQAERNLTPTQPAKRRRRR